MGKEVTSVELRQEHNDLRSASQSIIDKAREEKRQADAAAREAAQKARIEASLEASRNAGKRH